MSIAFFDLDKTILSQNSAKLWLKSSWHNRNIELKHMLKASYWLAKYHLGFTNLDNVIAESLSLMAGHSEEKVLDETRAFFRRDIKHLYRQGALRAIDGHRKSGHHLALLTSCFDGLAKLVSQDLKLEHTLCTKLEVDSHGLYTGKALGQPCFGRHKIIFAQRLCSSLNIELQNCSFYTDSASDLPLLKLVGRPVAVNPDPHLRAWARLKKWEIVDWGQDNDTKSREYN